MTIEACKNARKREVEATSQGQKIEREGGVSLRNWKIAFVLFLAVSVTAAFTGTSQLGAPPLLWNDSPSMDTGVYRKIDIPPSTGRIVSVEIPVAARAYARKRSIEISWGSFLKPIAAGGGDHVCVSLEKGLEINGEKLAGVRSTDSAGNVIAVWHQCRELIDNEYFLYAPRVPQSYDSRYYGPVRRESIKGVYEPLWTW